MSRMFSFITCTANPLGGECPGGCVYCWAQGEKGIAKRYRHEKYQGPPRIYEKVLRKRFGSGDFVFVVDMRDKYSPDVSREMILEILRWQGESPEAWFLDLTKWPERYLEFVGEIPVNVVLGATVESNRVHSGVSLAPSCPSRLEAMARVREAFPEHRLFVSVEPILKFELGEFIESLKKLRPWKVAVGHDNYGYRLDEPSKSDTDDLAWSLQQFTDIEVKSIRKAWWEE